ncbi:unnamed protein product [Staurois parvus]|uniref:Secreted protein n=1 Tax=Staurois parvus TaxID=386267 RepID=A0ABN9FS16_9NEOB|nr:unnamed protein product [Staurois parvus]
MGLLGIPPSCCCGSRVCHGSLYGLPLLLTSSPDSAMCHFQVSLHCWWVPFCDRVLYGLPLLLPPPPPCAMCLCRLLMLLTASAF